MDMDPRSRMETEKVHEQVQWSDEVMYNEIPDVVFGSDPYSDVVHFDNPLAPSNEGAADHGEAAASSSAPSANQRGPSTVEEDFSKGRRLEWRRSKDVGNGSGYAPAPDPKKKNKKKKPKKGTMRTTHSAVAFWDREAQNVPVGRGTEAPADQRQGPNLQLRKELDLSTDSAAKKQESKIVAPEASAEGEVDTPDQGSNLQFQKESKLATDPPVVTEDHESAPGNELPADQGQESNSQLQKDSKLPNDPAIVEDDRKPKNVPGSGTEDLEDEWQATSMHVKKDNSSKPDSVDEYLAPPGISCTPMQMLYLLADEGYTFRKQVYRKKKSFGHTLHPTWVCQVFGDKGGDILFRGTGGSNSRDFWDSFDFAVFDLVKRAKDCGLDLPGFGRDFYLAIEANLLVHSKGMSKNYWLGFDWDQDKDKYYGFFERECGEILFTKYKTRRVYYRRLSMSLKKFEKMHADVAGNGNNGNGDGAKSKEDDDTLVEIDEEVNEKVSKWIEKVNEVATIYEEKSDGGVGASANADVGEVEPEIAVPAPVCRCHLRYQRLRALNNDNGEGLRFFFNVLAVIGIFAIINDILVPFLVDSFNYIFY